MKIKSPIKDNSYTRLGSRYTLFLVVCGTFFLVVGIFSLRSNNINALRLRDNVNLVDQQNGNVEGALKELRVYVYAHMNTGLADGPNAIKPPIQLKYSYERLWATVNASVDNSKLYTDAQGYCEKTQSQGFYGKSRLGCIQDYIQSKGTAENPIQSVPDALYKFDFTSPLWSPDLAGWSLLLAAIAGLGVVLQAAIALSHKRQR